MNNFSFHNPVHIEFGKNTIAKLTSLVEDYNNILLVYGGGSIKKNGVYQQVVDVLSAKKMVEYGGIEANPEYETCVKAVDIVKNEGIDFILAVGGGSVVDAGKFIASAALYDGESWDILSGKHFVDEALPLGTVMTLPATGSEMNGNSVISRRELNEKCAFSSKKIYPVFSIMDPETTYSLPPRQVGNGIVDTFIHVMEQYLTYPVNALLQDKQAEGLLRTVMELAPLLRLNPRDYDAKSNFMWCSTMALNGIISCGVPQDWSTHQIGHELTAFYGLDHAQSLAVILPGVLSYMRKDKEKKLLQYADEVWGIKCGDKNVKIDEAIGRTILFFESVGVHSRLKDYGIDAEEAAEKISAKFALSGKVIGERNNIGSKEIREIILMRK